jgi:hypothetical protein
MTESRTRVLLLGAYGFFGRRIAAGLVRNPRVQLILAGRDVAKATALAYQLGLSADAARRVAADDPRLGLLLRKLGVNVLIHTAGPFQGQDYHVARAAIDAGCHYLDLADGRQFVTGISQLDAAARAAKLAVVTGVSTLPALSCAVVDRYRESFSRLDSVRIGISSGALVPGIATMRAVFGYVGQPIQMLREGQWVDVPGWLDRQTHDFPRPVGRRLLGACDVPDLILLPRRHAGLKTMTFHAGFASDSGHKAVELLARQVDSGRISSALPFARLCYRLASLLQSVLSDSGGMYVKLDGLDVDGEAQHLTWMVLAGDNHGPHIPCGPAIALTGKIAAGHPPPAGAQPCMGMLTVDEILGALKGLRIREVLPLQNAR